MLLTRTLAGLTFGTIILCAQSTSVTGIRVWSQPEVTRVIVEFTTEFKFKHGRLSAPDRVFFDISESSLRLTSAPDKRYSTTQVGDSFLQRIRAAESQAGLTRLVFDLTGERSEYAVSELANPPRLVVEFRAGSQKVTAAPPILPAPVVPSAPAAPPAPRITIDQMRRAADQAAATGKIATPPASLPARPAVSVPMLAPAIIPKDPPPAAARETAPKPAQETAPAAVPARRAGNSMTRALGLKLGKIVLDPGHGGHDLGTTSPSGMHEKDLVLDVAKRLGSLLESRLGSEVVYTRTDDTFVPLEKRTAFANSEHADLFVSIHANSSRVKSVWGPETFVLNFSASQDAMEVAARENATSEKTIFELQDLVKKIAFNEKLAESREFAGSVQSSMVKLAAASKSGRVRDRGVKRAPFVVLIGARMPSILTEIGFVTNSKEEARLGKPEYRQKIAEALAKGIAQYAGTLSRFQVASRTAAADSGTDGH